MSDIVVTGAAGRVGRQALAALSEQNVTAVTHRDHQDIESVIADVRDQSELEEAFEGHDMLIHLAGDSNAGTTWENARDINIDGTYHAYEAARKTGITRVIFASSHHTTGMYNVADPSNRGTMALGQATVLETTDPPRPDGYYGISKVTGESLGSFYADRYGMEVINFRIGWLLDRDELRDKQSMSPERARFARALWLSPRDCRQAIRRAVNVPLPEKAVTVHIISDNFDRYSKLTETIRTLGYHPVDDSSEVEGVSKATDSSNP